MSQLLTKKKVQASPLSSGQSLKDMNMSLIYGKESERTTMRSSIWISGSRESSSQHLHT